MRSAQMRAIVQLNMGLLQRVFFYYAAAVKEGDLYVQNTLGFSGCATCHYCSLLDAGCGEALLDNMRRGHKVFI